MKNLSRITALFLLIAVLASSFVLSAHAAKLTDAEYADLFKRASRYPELLDEVEHAFLADPIGFVQALAEEDYHTMYNVHFVTMSLADWASTPERYEHRDALLRVAYGEKLTQPQRRVVRYMLQYTKVMKGYVVYTDKIDYAELFARTQESDTNSSYYMSDEIIEVYRLDPGAFFEALALESKTIQHDVIPGLAYTLYYDNYDRDIEGKIINDLKDQGELSTRGQQLIADFWAKVDDLIQHNGQPPTRPTTPPSTLPSTGPTTPSLGRPTVSVGKKSFYEGSDITFTFSNVGNRTFTLCIMNPDATMQSYQPAELGDSMTFRFDVKGKYKAWIVVEEIGGFLYSDEITFNVLTKYTPPTLQPSTDQPDPPPEEKPLNIPTPWIIIGLVAVIFGVQAVAVVLYRKKSTPAEEDFDE